MPQVDCDGVGISLISLTIPHDFDFVQGVAVFWSLIPYAFLAVFFFTFFYTQRVSMFFFVVLGLISAAINEFAIKNIHQEDRPHKSCLDSGAFPSGHASIAALFFVWLVLETIIYKGWSIKKKIFTIIGLTALLGPCAPFRYVDNDHTWNQIAAGTIAGACWGIIDFIVMRLVIYFLEDLMCIAPFRWLHMRNDIRPSYEGSRHKGTKVPDATNVSDVSTPKNGVNFGLFLFTHILMILILVVLGVLGIILASVKRHDVGTKCDRSSWGVAYGVGILTLTTALFVIAVTILVTLKIKGKNWFPEVVQGLLLTGGCFFFEAFFWNVAGFQASDEDDNCPVDRSIDPTFAYVILWFVVMFVTWIIMSILAVKIDLRRVYGFRKSLIMKNSHTNTIKETNASKIHYKKTKKGEVSKIQNNEVPKYVDEKSVTNNQAPQPSITSAV